VPSLVLARSVARGQCAIELGRPSLCSGRRLGGVLVGWTGAAPPLVSQRRSRSSRWCCCRHLRAVGRRRATSSAAGDQEGANFVLHHPLLRRCSSRSSFFNTARRSCCWRCFVPYACDISGYRSRVRHHACDVRRRLWSVRPVGDAGDATAAVRHVIGLGPVTVLFAATVMALTTVMPRRFWRFELLPARCRSDPLGDQHPQRCGNR